MAESPRYSGHPRWVKTSGIIAIVLVLLFIVMHRMGQRGHGPAPCHAPEHGH